jgi:hypothetical protein
MVSSSLQPAEAVFVHPNKTCPQGPLETTPPAINTLHGARRDARDLNEGCVCRHSSTRKHRHVDECCAVFCFLFGSNRDGVGCAKPCTRTGRGRLEKERAVRAEGALRYPQFTATHCTPAPDAVPTWTTCGIGLERLRDHRTSENGKRGQAQGCQRGHGRG